MNLERVMIEPERYELFAAPTYHFAVDRATPDRFGMARRDFFKTLGAGFVVVSFCSSLKAQESGSRGRGRPQIPQEIGAWLHISEKGRVTAFTGKVEVGQNTRTMLTLGVAEELGAPISAIEVVMGDTDRVPYDMGTFGSMSTPQMLPQIRKVSAAARQLLPQRPWDSIDFAAVVKDESLFKSAAGAITLKPATDWTVLGTSTKKVTGRDVVTGRHKYTSDMKRPGMMYGRILRPDRFGAMLTSLDAKEARNMQGVAVVREGSFVGVAAPNPTLAASALATMKAEWKAPAQTSSKTLFSDLKPAGMVKPHPEIDKAVAEADKKLEHTYTVAYIAHAPLEPRAAVAEWTGDKLTVWTGTQVPFGVKSELAEAFVISDANVRVIVPDTGSGYGGKHTGETAIEAARLARAVGRPVKLVWTREEEFTWAYFRPAGVIDVRSALSADGRITAWDFHNYNSGASGINSLYDIPRKRTEFHNVKSPLRQGSYRGLAATANHFARESHMDELAALAGAEPLEFRLRHLKDERFRAVLEAVAERFGWGKKKSGAGVGFGIAGGFEKGGYVATCAEVVSEPGRGPRVTRIVEAFECGAIANPDHLKLQVEGAVVQGLGGALFEAIDFENGKILNARFSRYRVPRFRDVPPIEVVLVNRKDLPSAGAGETPIVGVAPAIANAIFAATGERLRSMPLVPAAG